MEIVGARHLAAHGKVLSGTCSVALHQERLRNHTREVFLTLLRNGWEHSLSVLYNIVVILSHKVAIHQIEGTYLTESRVVHALFKPSLRKWEITIVVLYHTYGEIAGIGVFRRVFN